MLRSRRSEGFETGARQAPAIRPRELGDGLHFGPVLRDSAALKFLVGRLGGVLETIRGGWAG
eukprot:4435502-Alexandrium_andersonii.AAC.1